MASNTLNEIRIALKSGTTAEWAASTLVLLKGEMAIELTSDGFPKIKLGDGVKMFKDLPYANLSDTEIKTLISQFAVNNVALVTGASNGQIGITVDGTTTYANVKGLGDAAYKNSSAFATAAQGTKADNAMPKSGGTFTGAITLNADPTTNLGAATKQYVDKQVAAGISSADALILKGTLGTSGTITALPTTYKTGWAYIISSAGTFAGQGCEVGDMIIAVADSTGTANNAHWAVIQANLQNALTGVGAGLTRSGATVMHSNSITAGTAQGGSGSVAWGGSVAIPKITYDSTGHITGVTTTSITFPANPNVDTKVTNTVNNAKKFYITGSESASTNTGGQIFNSNVYVAESGNDLHATKFTGNLAGNVTGNVSGSSGSCTGNSATASKLASPKSIGINGGVTGSATNFDGSSNITIQATAVNTDFLRNGSNVLILNCGGAS